MAQTGYTPILVYASGTATNVPLAANLTSSASGAELALNYADGKLYYKNSSGVVTLLASTAGASGDVVGPASATDNALARFDTTTGKLIQNSVGILSDTGALSGLTDISASGSVTLSGGTANGVSYLNASKVLTTGSALVFDGTNLGIGTSSPLTKLEVAGGDVLLRGGKYVVGPTVGGNGAAAIRATLSGVLGSMIFQTENSSAVLTDVMTLDSSGNLGLGVTPSAWFGVYRAMQIGSYGAAIAGQTNDQGLSLWSNAYPNAGNVETYVASSYATKYRTENGAHKWFTAPPGTAGNAIAFAQAMTLDASGKLLIGLTSAGVSALQVNRQGVTSSPIFTWTNNANNSGHTYIFPNGAGISADGFLAFGSNEAGAGTFTERARIPNGGGISIFSLTTANDTLDSCNNQAAGTTYSTFIGRHSATSPFTGTVSCRIYTNGNIINTNNSYGAISDVKLKENIVDATPKLHGLMQVRIVNYNLIGDTNKQIGVIAQELEQVFPSMVDESPDFEEITTIDEAGEETTERVASGSKTKQVKYSVFVPMLIKAIQEQQALIQSLTARLDAANL